LDEVFKRRTVVGWVMAMKITERGQKAAPGTAEEVTEVAIT